MVTKTWRRGCLAISVVFVICLLGMRPVQAANHLNGVQKWHPWFELGGFYNSDNASRGEVVLFAPFAQSNTDLFFIDARGKFFEDDVKEGNFALGYRRMHSSGFNFGAWLGADARSTERNNGFWQLSGGLEALSYDFDARLNLYGPTTEPKGVDAASFPNFTQVFLRGNNILMIGGEEVALQGVDGELGIRVPLERVGLGGQGVELRAYGGGFYFDDSDALEEVAGGKGRLELRINDIIPSMPGSRLTAEYEFSYDDVREERHEVGLRIRFPFGDNGEGSRFAAMTMQEQRMVDSLERDTDIATVQSKEENVEDALTGTDFDRVAFASQSSSVTTTSTAAGPNSLIILNGRIVGGQALQGNQTLQGGSSTIQVRGRNSGTVIGFTAPGAAGRLRNPGSGQDNLTLIGSNTHVSGIRIVGRRSGPNRSDDGVDTESDKTNIYLTNLDIRRTGGDGIDIDNDNDVNILGVSIRRPRESGIDINNRNNVSISDTIITNPNDDGISLRNRNNVLISGLTIDGAGDDGIEMRRRNTVSVLDSAITDSGWGFFLFDRNNDLTLTNVSVTNITYDGILVDDRNNRITVLQSTFSDIGVDVFDLFRNTTILVSGTTFSGAVGNDVFDFGPNNIVLPGSTDNVNSTTSIGGRLCRAGGGRSFTGTIGLVDGTVLEDDTGGAGNCN